MEFFQYRVTHFEPTLRDARGRFLGDKWTSASDIGKRFGGDLLTSDDYLTTETAYISALLILFDASGLGHLRATNVRKAAYLAEQTVDVRLENTNCDDLVGMGLNALTIPYVEEDQVVERQLIEPIARTALREIEICRLEIDGGFFVHFGWDYYMYVGCQLNPLHVQKLLRNKSLFVEECISPYGCGGQNTRKCTLELFDRISDEHVQDILLGELEIGTVKSVLGVSNEHPACGAFDVNETSEMELGEIMGSAPDFSRFFYRLDTQG